MKIAIINDQAKDLCKYCNNLHPRCMTDHSKYGEGNNSINIIECPSFDPISEEDTKCFRFGHHKAKGMFYWADRKILLKDGNI